MNKTIIYLSCLFIVLTSSCSESDTDSPPPDITVISGDSVIIMTTGAVCSIDFNITNASITPTDIINDSSNYAIELLIAESNITPVYYKLVKVEQINIIGTKSATTTYRAYIEDLCIKNNYCDKVNLVLRDKAKGTSYVSSTFIVQYYIDDLTKSLLEIGLPLVVINTVKHEEPTCEYVSAPDGCWGSGIMNATKIPGSIAIMEGSDITYYSGEYDSDKCGMTIKIRGNSSAYYDKKPYKIKLQKKADLLNRRSDKDYSDKEWLLLCYDKLKALIGFKVNELMQMQWTPSFQFVNVIINGDYRGLYMLAESVKRNTECRLNVNKTGYIIEYDAYWWNENKYFISDWAYPMNYTFKYPDDDDVTKEQIDYIKSYIDSLEIKINNGEAYEQFIDVESWARWVLAHDILGTLDSGGSNFYITKYDNTESSKLMMANLWDFDSSYLLPDTWSNAHQSQTLYSYKLFHNPNPIFKNTFKSIWEESYNEVFTKLDEFLMTFENTKTGINLNKATSYDNARWNTTYDPVAVETAFAINWFKNRLQFLKGNIPDL